MRQYFIVGAVSSPIPSLGHQPITLRAIDVLLYKLEFIEEATKMKELKDYSGEYVPNLKLEDLSKECLVRLFNAAGKLYLGLDRHWNAVTRERFGDRISGELERDVWMGGATRDEIKRTLKAANIQGDDVVALAKVFQVDPAIHGVNEIELELKGRNHGIFTIKRCVTLDALEKQGDPERIRFACELDALNWPIVGQTVNPKMKHRMLKLPPRKSKDEIACQMEYWIED